MSRLHMVEHGSGEPLIMIHGWAMHSGVWGEFAQTLARHFRVICVDLPGHGQSRKEPFELDGIIDGLLELAPEKPCAWLGWSMGATIALELAGRHPERVARLILLAGSPCFVKRQDWSGMRIQLLNSFSQFLIDQPEATLARFMALQVLGEPDSRLLLGQLKASLEQSPTPSNVTLQKGIELLKEKDLREVFATLNMPVLVCLGEQDTLVPIAIKDALHELLPGIQLLLLNNAGHLFFLTHVQQVVDQMIGFIRGH